ncbi:hypothetical protein cand_018570 [Cryptosporidium andersoni]|uniref:Pre-mRNA-splicing factor CWC2 n=1 Tax=Cryptosporidium andersoni TaxID=117008 RepID=A0A1J4M9X5_9CRYT|nr:hypothetical protein cand_018570 [Cryptosporidium andersoni]
MPDNTTEVYLKYDKKPSVTDLGRPARVQCNSKQNIAYIEGGEQYNIWYGRYVYDYAKRTRLPAQTRCNPIKDIGWTKADTEPGNNLPSFCLYFARGCCTNGASCKYYHHLPTREDDDGLSPMYDIFGRERHAQHKDDMSGAGCFKKDSRTIFIGEIFIDRQKENYNKIISDQINKEFNIWGPIEYSRVILNKSIAFIRYSYRASAEFAKIAMDGQKLGNGCGDNINVKWAYDDPNPYAIEAQNEMNSLIVENAVSRFIKRKRCLLPKDNIAMQAGFYMNTSINNLNKQSEHKDPYTPITRESYKIIQETERIEAVLENVEQCINETEKNDKPYDVVV